MHEASETQSKPSYFRGQCWGGLGILTGTLAACFCCPLQLQIYQGFAHLGLTDESESQPQLKSTERMVAMAVAFATSNQCLCYLVLDAFFSTSSVIRARNYYSIEHKKPWVEILTKAKKTPWAIFLPCQNPQAAPVVKPFMVKKSSFRNVLIITTCLRLPYGY